ncbi:hypothetical protein M501DRAFT_1019559 [Patellaria atrata CBS 101060]|uniref:C2H2-type domain-containing protein n=1 Tax=Patellaria atrata CBS 101060 TaxID=1346257 RepID=A0A9P4S689_9PEZI|nr:hypothetical protein M501DRAFT_1019559 [Patellaria atrata CBS 101060]
MSEEEVDPINKVPYGSFWSQSPAIQIKTEWTNSADILSSPVKVEYSQDASQITLSLFSIPDIRRSENKPDEQCRYCGEYLHYNDMDHHIEEMHRNGSRICPKCRKTCYSHVELKNHIRACHPGDNPFVCQYCSSGIYSDIEFLTAQERTKHSKHCFKQRQMLKKEPSVSQGLNVEWNFPVVKKEEVIGTVAKRPNSCSPEPIAIKMEPTHSPMSKTPKRSKASPTKGRRKPDSGILTGATMAETNHAANSVFRSNPWDAWTSMEAGSTKENEKIIWE